MAKTFRKYAIESERMEELRALSRKGPTPRNLAKRVRIVLLSAEGKNTDETREVTGAAEGTVYTRRRRYARTIFRGSNRARKTVYRRISKFRRSKNNMEGKEPAGFENPST